MPKNKSSPFMCFVMELKNKSGKNWTTAEAVNHAGKIWEQMNAADKKRYNDLAKNTTRSARPIEKLDCLGRPISQVQKQRELEEEKQRNMKRNIENIVKKAIRDGTFETQKFYFVGVNYFTKTNENVYVPAEFAISEFSLKDGVCRPYHTFLCPNANTFGYQYDTRKHAEETHMLPLPPKAMGERNLSLIYNHFLDYIRDPMTGEIPPVYTHRDQMAVVESALSLMETESTIHADINVYSIHYLFYIMKCHCAEIGETKKPTNIFVTDAQFDTDAFDYEIGISCEYHEKKDRTKYCALSYVVRWGYMFAAYMCRDIAIIPIPGKHVPMKTKLNCITIEPKPQKAVEKKAEEPAVDAQWAKHWANEPKVVPNEKPLSEDHFPALGANTSTSKHASVKKESFNFTDDFDLAQEDNSNPWSRSMRKKPQEPDSSAFSINFNSTRTNQTLLEDDDKASLASILAKRKPIVAAAGRGKIY